MKKWIHSASSADLSMKETKKSETQKAAQRAARIRKDLDKFNKDDVAFVKECYDTVTDAISKYYSDEDDPKYLDRSIGTSISSIKTDYLLEALEEGYMTEDEFDVIYMLLEELGAVDAMPYA